MFMLLLVGIYSIRMTVCKAKNNKGRYLFLLITQYIVVLQMLDFPLFQPFFACFHGQQNRQNVDGKLQCG